jgi:hypothetical protein
MKQRRFLILIKGAIHQKKIEITPCILSDQNAIKLELNNKSRSRKYMNNWRLKNTLLNNQWIIEEIR